MSEKVLFPKSTVWTEKKIDIAWTILSYSRRELMLTISPTVASSFIYLHYYFRRNEETPYKLYLLLTSSLFLACKIDDFYRPVEIIFRQLSQTIVNLQRHVPIDVIKAAVGDRDFSNQKLESSEIAQVASIEIEILNCISWDLCIDLPFVYINKNRGFFDEIGDKKLIDKLMNIIIRNLCLVVKSIDYLDYDVELSAAASVLHGFTCLKLDIPQRVNEWISVKKANNEEQFTLIFRYVKDKAEKCVRL